MKNVVINKQSVIVSLDKIKSQEDFNVFTQSFYNQNPLELMVVLDWLSKNENKFTLNLSLGDGLQSPEDCFKFLASVDYFLDKVIVLFSKEHKLLSDEDFFEEVAEMLGKDNYDNYRYFLKYMEDFFPESVSIWIEAIMASVSEASQIPDSIISSEKKSEMLLSNLFFSEMVDEDEDEVSDVETFYSYLSEDAKNNQNFMKIFEKYFTTETTL